jgi:hypothetical protein
MKDKDPMPIFRSVPTLTILTAASLITLWAQAGPAQLQAQNSGPAGLYAVESRINFNVLDSVYFDAASGELALMGHRDDRFKGTGIPYLQYLATLLENPKPEFSLKWTPDSSARVDSLLARELTQQESDAQAVRLGTMADSSGMVTHTGALMLPALGIYPINDNRAPGDLGVETQSWNGGVLITKVKPGSAADAAGLKIMDVIISVRPDRPVFFASEFERQIRFAGAGAEIEVKYQRSNEIHTTKATLDAAANADPWYEVNRYDVIAMMYRVTGDPVAANAVDSLGIMTAMITQKEQYAGLQTYGELMSSLGMASDFQHLQEIEANGAPSYDDSYNFSLKLSRQMDSIFHFVGNPLENSFESSVRQTHDPGNGITVVFNQFDVLFKPKYGELMDKLILRPGVGFEVPPELVEDEYHIHPEMLPQYLGVPKDSQLAGLMLASDYLCKQLANRQDLKRTIPGYQTQVEYQINHPEATRQGNSAYRVWISVAGINAAQSTDGRMLVVRDARMHFNIRETDSNAIDLPNQQSGGYADVLTGLYDQFELEFPTLHELREAAKLAEVAAWMQNHDRTIRLPAEGRATWNGPEKVDGLVYIYLTNDLHHNSQIFKMSEGGVSLVPPVTAFPVDSSVVDSRGSSSMTAVFARPDTAAIRDSAVVAPAGESPFVTGWVAPVGGGTPGQEAVVLEARLTKPLNREEITRNAASDSACGVGGCSDLKDAVAECSGANCSQPIKSKALMDARRAAASIPSAECIFDGREGCRNPVPLAEVVIDGNPLSVPQYAKDFVDAIPKEARNDKVNLEIKNYEYFASKRAEKQNQVLADKAAVAKNPADQNAKNLLNQHVNELKIATGDEKHAQERVSMQIGLIGTPPATKNTAPPNPGQDKQNGKTQ